MNNEQIFSYFGNNNVYKYSGSLSELKESQESTNNGYNYIVVSDVIYFVAIDAVTDPKAQLIMGE
jgi:hypothetical protein